jgi:hypothetical protein
VRAPLCVYDLTPRPSRCVKLFLNTCIDSYATVENPREQRCVQTRDATDNGPAGVPQLRRICVHRVVTLTCEFKPISFLKQRRTGMVARCLSVSFDRRPGALRARKGAKLRARLSRCAHCVTAPLDTPRR